MPFHTGLQGYPSPAGTGKSGKPDQEDHRAGTLLVTSLCGFMLYSEASALALFCGPDSFNHPLRENKDE